ncbi:hypothetical protein N7513_007946 [Penicillium frequentans]|nr:hypothetical protein N7513_007946 [Penicillium glabrum]
MYVLKLQGTKQITGNHHWLCTEFNVNAHYNPRKVDVPSHGHELIHIGADVMCGSADWTRTLGPVRDNGFKERIYKVQLLSSKFPDLFHSVHLNQNSSEVIGVISTEASIDA